MSRIMRPPILSSVTVSAASSASNDVETTASAGRCSGTFLAFARARMARGGGARGREPATRHRSPGLYPPGREERVRHSAADAECGDALQEIDANADLV